MGRTARDKRDLPHPEPVERIELSEKHMGLRVAAVILFLALGLGTIAYALFSLLGSKTGWVTIEANNGSLGDISKEFVFQYRLGAADLSPTEEKKALTLLYGEAVRRAYQIFVAKDADADEKGLASLNAHPDMEFVVDPGLYEALSVATKDDNRAIYLGPLYAQYDSLFCSKTDQEAAECDPERNAEVRSEVERLMTYVSDPSMIDLKLLGDNRVLLNVSVEYLAYLKENWDTTYLGFGWMRNAFVSDYIADTLLDAGYANGLLISEDGFVRNMYDGKEEASYAISRRDEGIVSSAGAFRLSGAVSVVYLHDYPLLTTQENSYYVYEDGTIRAPYVNVEDGMLQCATHELILAAPKGDNGKTMGLGELVMHAQEVYAREDLDRKALADLMGKGIGHLFFENGAAFVSHEWMIPKME